MQHALAGAALANVRLPCVLPAALPTQRATLPVEFQHSLVQCTIATRQHVLRRARRAVNLLSYSYSRVLRTSAHSRTACRAT